MSLTLGLTGMDPDTEKALKAAVVEANATLAQPWQLLPEAQADHVVVDMDSMYGPMSWLRLHAAGKQVIGLSAAARTQTDFHLSRPFDTNSVAALLEQAAGAVDAPAQAPVVEPPDASKSQDAPHVTASKDPDEAAPAPAATRGPMDADPALPPSNDPLIGAPSAGMDAADSEVIPAQPSARTAGAPERVPVERERTLADWLVADALRGRVRYHPGDGPALLIDADRRQYHGPAALKPLAGIFGDVLESDDFTPLDDAAWADQSAALGPAQPLSRLQWYGGLLAGKGELLQGFDPQGRYTLGKWPQTEREFPRHFRLATTMMKGAASLHAIASASGVPYAEVVDFVNANLVSGYAESVPETPLAPVEPTKPAGLFGRLRGK